MNKEIDWIGYRWPAEVSAILLRPFGELDESGKQTMAFLGDEQLGSHPGGFVDTPEEKGLCAFVGDMPVGYATYGVFSRMLCGTGRNGYDVCNEIFGESGNRAVSHIGRIFSLVVDPGYRNLGIGTRLVAGCLSLMKFAEWVGVVAWSSKRGVMAKGIVEKAGFAEIGIRERFWENSGVPCPDCGRVCLCSAVLYKLVPRERPTV